MKVSGPKRDDSQQAWLFPETNDRALTSLGAIRSWVGDFFEDACVACCNTRVSSRAIRLKTDSRADICPDVFCMGPQIDKDCYIETKGVGQTNQGIIYEWRHQKYCSFVNDHCKSVFYWFFRHRFHSSNASTMNGLWLGLGSSTFNVAVVDHNTFHGYLEGRPKGRINSQYGKGRPGTSEENARAKYGVGWRFPVADMASLGRSIGYFRSRPFNGTRLAGVEVFVTTEAAERFF